MKYKITTVALMAAVLSLPVSVRANEPVAATQQMSCPMMGSMQKDMGSMMGDMDSMMQTISDPAMKERMQKMHEQMGSMMQQMTDMQKGMMKGGSMGGKKETAAPAANTEDHKAHHPDKQ